jgi:TonB-linked SusC/RagA family outer membrane protein
MNHSRCTGRRLALAAAVFWVVLTPASILAQATGTIQGTVTAAGTGRAMANVQIQVLGTTLSASTDLEGRYVIRDVPVGQRTIRASAIGYQRLEATVTVMAGQTVPVNFTLERAIIQLDEVVVTGTAGGQAKRELGITVSSIPVTEKLEDAPIKNVVELLTARTPGLTLLSNSGQVGSSSNIRIRGAGSLTAGYNPVFYVDGVRIESGTVEATSLFQGGTALDFLNPDDIESIEVIKGPAASTLYGADAANGVIQIITKKGRGTQAAQWTVRGEVGQNEWVRSVSGDHYRTYRRCTVAMQNNPVAERGCAVAAGVWPADSLKWWGKDSKGKAVLYAGIPDSDIIRIPGSQEFVLRDDPLFRHPAALRKGNSYDLDLSVRGGAGNMGYFASFNRSSDDGVYFNNFSRRIGGRGNFDFQVGRTLNMATQFSYARTHLQQPLANNASNGIIRNASRGRARGQTAPWEPGFLGFSPWLSNEFDDQIRSERMTIGQTGNWQPFTWMRHKLTLGLDKHNYRETIFYKQDTTGRAPWGTINATGVVDHEIVNIHRWTVDYSGSLDTRLTSSLSSVFSAGMQLNARTHHGFFALGQGLVANKLNLVSSAATRDAGEERVQQTSLGFFLEERVGWRDRMYLTGAVRIDDNSAFGADFSLVVYPKASFSWMISEEDFFKLGFVNDLKLRAAWGEAGNAPAPFTADRTYTSGRLVTLVGTAETLVNTLVISSYGNPKLKAETGSEWEAGFDASLLDQRVGIEFTYYNKRTKDALISVPDPRSTGFTGNHLVNVGEIANSGIELLLNLTPVETRSFSWDATLSFSTNNNKLVSFGRYPDGTPIREEIVFGAFADVQRHREGYPLGAFWAWDVERGPNGKPIVYDAAGNVIANPVLDAPGQSVRVLSRCRWAPSDPNWDRERDCQDIYMGPSVPPREASLTSTFTLFNNLSLFAQFDYRGGHYQWCALCSVNSRIDLNTWDVNTGGTPLNPDVTVADVLALRSLQTLSHISKADFVKFRELSLTYTLPRSLTSSLPAIPGSRWTLTVSGRNLALWTKYKGKGDPEVNFNPDSFFQMLDYASTPQSRRLSASLRVSF